MELQASTGLTTRRWYQGNWAACPRRIRSLQRRSVQAVQAGAWRKGKRLSSQLGHAFAACAFAVKRVTERTGTKTPPALTHPGWEEGTQRSTSCRRQGKPWKAKLP